MDFGNKIIYKCPKCGRLVGEYELISATSSGGETLYSDGTETGIMYADYTEITKCKKCKTIYWLKGKNITGEYTPGTRNPEWGKAPEPELLDENDFIEALKQKLYKNKDEEYYLRNCLWLAFNDRKRYFVENPDFTKDEEKVYEANCKELIKFLNIEKIKEKLLIAELYRNTGDFSKCIEILETVKRKEYTWIKNRLLEECKKKNREVIMLTRRGEKFSDE